MRVLGLSVWGFPVALAALSLVVILMGCELKSEGVARDAKSGAKQSARLKGDATLVAASDDEASDETSERAADVDPDGSDAEFASAAAENARLKTGLEWAFGGKAQRGWYLYTLLIRETLGTEKGEETRAFAAALARWQKSQALAPSGILDSPTLFRFIEVWQSRRLKDKTVATPDRLLTVPVADFYDPTRAEELRKVELQTYAAYKLMVAAAAQDLKLGRTRDGSLSADEKYLKIVSAFRSPEYQEKLRQASPNSGPAGLAKVSPHFTGRALDLYVGGDPVSTEDSNRALQVNTKAYHWLVKNADRFGFRPYFYEPWHWEYVGQK